MGINGSHKGKITVGLIGLGDISDIHIKTYLKRSDVVINALSDINHGLLSRKGKELGVDRLYPDYNYMFSDPNIDVIDVMTPHFLHKECVVNSLKCGKNVICEKPIATNVADIDAMVDASKKYKKDVYVKQYLRYSKAFIKAKEIIDSGKIGRPYFADCVYTSHAVNDFIENKSWKGNVLESGGGVFISNGIHFVDLMHHFFGSVSGCGGNFKNVENATKGKGEDFANVHLEFKNGVSTNIVCTENDIGYRFRWELKIYGTKGIIHVFDDRKFTKTLNLIVEGKIVYKFIEDSWWDNSNIYAIDDAVDRIKNKLSPFVSLGEAREILAVVLKSYEAGKFGKFIKL